MKLKQLISFLSLIAVTSFGNPLNLFNQNSSKAVKIVRANTYSLIGDSSLAMSSFKVIGIVSNPGITSDVNKAIRQRLSRSRWHPSDVADIARQKARNSHKVRLARVGIDNHYVNTAFVQGGRTRNRGQGTLEHPTYLCSEYKARIHYPYWRIFENAVKEHSRNYPKITPSLIAAIAVQESGHPGASFPDNSEYPGRRMGKRTSSATGMFQISFDSSTTSSYTMQQILKPQAATKYPKLAKFFKQKGITPAQAKDVKKAANWGSEFFDKNLKDESIKRYGIRGAIGYYAAGHNWRDKKGNETTQPTNWDIDSTSTIPDFVKRVAKRLPHKNGIADKIKVPYITSVLWHQKIIEDAERKCNPRK